MRISRQSARGLSRTAWVWLALPIVANVVALMPAASSAGSRSDPSVSQLGRPFQAKKPPSRFHRPSAKHSRILPHRREQVANARPRANLRHAILLPQLGKAAHLHPRPAAFYRLADLAPPWTPRSCGYRSDPPRRAACSALALGPDEPRLRARAINVDLLIMAPIQRGVSFGDYDGLIALGIPLLADVPPIVIINPPHEQTFPFAVILRDRTH